MVEQQALPMLVVSQRADDAEAISQTLRNAGCVAQCHTLADGDDLTNALSTHQPVIVFVCDSDPASERFMHCVQTTLRHATEVPVLGVQARVSEESIAAAMEAGATDLVSLGNKARLQAVSKREIARCQQARDLQEMASSTEALEQQLEALVKDSPDALLHIQEGIVTAANPAWLELLGYAEQYDIVGTPALDVFDEESHAALKGALAACAQGNWTNHVLDLKMRRADGEVVATKNQIEQGTLDDEPCVRLVTNIDPQKDEQTPKQIVDASAHHPLTGFYRRQRFLTEIEDRLEVKSQGGVYVLAYVKLDNIHRVREQLGPISSDDLLLEFAKILQEQVRETDLYGQFGGDLFMVLLPRGTLRDAVAWGEQLRSQLDDHLFEIQEKSISISCTVGLAQHLPTDEDVADLVLRAQKAYQLGNKHGGNTVSAPQVESAPTGHKEGDTAKVQQIKTALMRDNFRLVYQPVASLNDNGENIFDALVRMIDDEGHEIMPSNFLPTASRNGMMKTIDRWVIATAIRFCKQQSCKIFVRLSPESLLDPTLFDWIKQQVTGAGINPSLMLFEISESEAENHLKECIALTKALKSIDCSVAIEHFGIGAQPLQLLEHLPLDFIKIDGSLMEGITTDKKLQAKVREYVTQAQTNNIHTVAERVEDANTMAVLWQVGVEYIQGFYVQGPEEIVMES